MRGGRLFLPLALTLALIVNAVPVLPASAASKPGVSGEFVAADFVSAQVKAKSLHHRILVSGELTETSTSWVNEDGTVTSDVSGSPVRVRDDAGLYGWRDLDYTLRFGVDGFVEPVSGLYPLKLSGGGTATQVAANGLVSVSGSNGLQIGFGWAGPLPTPVLDGSCALYGDVLPGTDIRVCLTVDGFEQFFVLKSKPTQQVLDALVLPMNLAKASVVSDGAGGFSFKDAAGAVVGTVPTPTMADSALLSLPDSTVLAPDLVGSDSNAGGSAGAGAAAGDVTQPVLRLNVDATYFDNPDLVYPVVVDPAVSLAASFDSYVSSAALTTDYSSSTNLWVGTNDSGASKYRSYLNFDGSKFAGATVTDAQLKLWLNTSTSCTASTLTVYAAKPVTGSTRWGSQPTVYSNYSGTLSSAAGFSSSCPASIQTIDVTSPIAAEAKSNWPTAGLTLRASETSNTGFKKFNSSEASTKRPQLTVTYNHLSVVPTPTVDGGLTVGSNVYTAQAQPTFSVTATDADAQKLTYTFKYVTVAGPYQFWSTACSVGPLASGVKASCPSSQTLTDLTSYTVYVEVTDGFDIVLNTNPLIFSTDLTAPTTPTFGGCPYQNNSWSAQPAATTFSCVLNTVTGATIFYSVDGGPVINGGSKNVSVTFSSGAAMHQVDAYTLGASGLVSNSLSYVFTLGTSGMITPINGASSSGVLPLSAFGHDATGNPTSARLWFEPATSTTWVSADYLPVTTKNGVSGVYDYGLNLSFYGANTVAQMIGFKVCFSYANAPTDCTGVSYVVYNPNPFATGQPVTSAGNGSLNLRTGDFKLSTTDVSIDTPAGGFSVARTLTTNTTPSNGFAGNGWQSAIDGSNTGLSTFDLVTTSGGLVVFEDHEGSALLYQLSGNTYVPLGVETAATGIKLSTSGSGASQTFSLTQTNGWVTTWLQKNSVWVLGSVSDPSNSYSYCTTYDPFTNKPLVLRQAPGVVTNLCTTVAAGTKELVLTYGGVTSGTDYEGYLKTVAYNTYNQASNTPTTSTIVAAYSYDTSGRLSKVVDPRNGVEHSYSYETYTVGSNTFTRVTGETFSGVAATKYFYASNKLIRVARDNTLNPADGFSVQNTYLYTAPITGAGLPTIASDKSVWGQKTTPTSSTVSFGSDSNLLTTTPTTPVTVTSLTAAQLKKGSYTYFDSFGRQTNTAENGLNKWLYSYQNFDTTGKIITSFDSNNIDLLQQKIGSEPHVDINQYSTTYRYNNAYTAGAVIGGGAVTATMPAGVQLLDVWGPIQQSDSAGGGVQYLRPHTHNVYDQNAPNNGLNPLTGLFYGFVTSTKTGLVTPTTALTSVVDDVVLGETRYNYDDQVTGRATDSTTSGWVVGKPTKTSTYDSAGVLTGESVNVYNTNGQTLQSAGPGQTITGVNGGTATTALAQINVYYTASVNTRADCGSHPEYAGLLCWSGNTAGDVSTLPSTTITSYNQYSQAVTSVEKAGVTPATRTTINTYLSDGRLNTTSVAVTGVASNTTVLPTTTLYDTATGAKTGEQQTTGAVTATNVATFDSWGRVITYTNSVGDVTTTTYVPTGVSGAGQIASETTTNNAGVVVVSNVYSYDGVDALGNNETRGLLTKKVVTAAGQSLTYQAAYNQTGELVKQTGPAGLSQENIYDDSGRLIGTTYNGTDTSSGAPTDQAWFSWSKIFDPSGRVSTLTGPSNSFTGTTMATKTFSYDNKHHLTAVQTQALGITDCSLNTYSFDNVGNKTGITKGTGVTGTCQTNISANKTQNFNAYSQLTATGYVYDQLGRNTTIAAGDTQNSSAGNITLGYDSNDNITTITQGGVATTYGYDPAQRNLTQTSTGSVTTDHFVGTSDAAAYTTQKTTAGTLQQTDVYANAIGDGLNTTISTTQTGTTNTTQVVDLLGSVVANIDTTAAGNATGPTSFQSFDEYGQPETATNQTPASTIQNYGWAGGANRQTESTGLILMGARVYNPVTGQFTSPDPIPGGNENTYTYPNDPINQNDYTGCWPWDSPSEALTFSSGFFLGLAGAAFCVAVAVSCLAVGLAVGIASGGFGAAVSGINAGHRGWSLVGDIAVGSAIGALGGYFGGTAGNLAESASISIGHALVRKALVKSTETLADMVVEEGMTRGVNALRGSGELHDSKIGKKSNQKISQLKFKYGGFSGGHYFYH